MNRRHLKSSPFKAANDPPPEIYEVGDRVLHDTFGLGRVVAVQGTFAVQVDFTSTQERVTLPCRRMSHL